MTSIRGTRSVVCIHATIYWSLGMRDALSDLSGMDTGTEASTDVEESNGMSDSVSARRPKLITPDAFTHSASKHSYRPESSNSNGSSVTSVSALNLSQHSVDDILNSSASSRLSESTLRSSMQDGTPQSSFVDESHVMTPTSLPLPQTPPAHSAPDASSVPIPTFHSTLQSSSPKEVEPLMMSVAAANTECGQSTRDIEEASMSPEGEERYQRPSSEEREVEVEVILEDEAKEEAEDLPEAQKPGAEGEEEDRASCEVNVCDNLVCDNLSTSHRMGPLIDLTDEEKVENTQDAVHQSPARDVHREARFTEREEDIPTGRESPESADAIPVTMTPPMQRGSTKTWPTQSK